MIYALSRYIIFLTFKNVIDTEHPQNGPGKLGLTIQLLTFTRQPTTASVIYCEHYRTSSGKNHLKRWLLVDARLPYDVR